MMRDTAIQVMRAAGVLAAWVFGSRVDGTSRTDSDIDVAVLVSPAPSLLRVERLSRELEPHLGAPVDLVDFLTAPLPLQARIVRTGELLFSDDEPRRVAETVRVQGMWPDVQRSLREMDAAFLARVAAGGLADG